MNKTKLFVLPVLLFPFLIGCGGTKEYTITWKNWDDSILSETKVKENETPAYDKGTPSKPSTETEAFTFNGWTPEIVKATADATYTATYTPVKIYEISWYNDLEETKLLHSEKVKLGDTPTYHWKDKPSKPGEDRIRYDWDGWQESIVPVEGPAKYHAKFTEVTKWEVIFKNDDGTELQKSFVAEDEIPIYTGKTPTKPISDGKLYTFKDWDSELVKPTKDTVYTATYDYQVATVTMTVNATEDVEESDTVSFMYEFGKEITAVDWGDGEVNTNSEHTYTTKKEYTVNIWGSFTSFITQSRSVSSITLSNQITTIEEYAFAFSNLKRIYIPSSVTTIERDAFISCYSLTIFCEVEEKQEGWDSDWNYSDSPVYWGYVSSGSTINFDYIVQNVNNVEQIVILEYIGEIAATSITIPATINEIPVATIGKNVFNSLENLESVFIPSSVTTIEGRAFQDCGVLTIYCEAEAKPEGWNYYWNYSDNPVYWGYVSSGSITNFKYIVQKFNNIEQISITEYTGDIAATSITIPNTIKVDNDDLNVTSIGHNIFCDNAVLETIIFPDTLTSIGDYAFSWCRSLTGTIDIPNVKSIGNNAFNNTAITSVTNTDNLLSIGKHAFANCSSLTSMVIPNNIVSIGISAFAGSSVGNVSNNLRYVGNASNEHFALSGVEGEVQEEYTIESDCKIIIGYAFAYCDAVTSFTIPNSVYSIGDQTFYVCSSLTTVDLSAVNHLITGGNYMFLECDALEKIIVKPELVDDYKEAPYWSDYAEYIQVAQ